MNWTFVTWCLYLSPYWPKTADVSMSTSCTDPYTAERVLQTVYRRKSTKKQTNKLLALKRLSNKWDNDWRVVIMTASVICRNIASLWQVPVTFRTNSGKLPSCLSHEWKKPKTWNVEGDKFRNLLSNSQVCAVHRFWIICRIISRNFA